MLLSIFDLEQTLTVAMIWEAYIAVMIAMVLSYFSIAGSAYYLFWSGQKIPAEKLRETSTLPGQVRYEITWSLRNILLSSSLTVLLILAWRAGLFPQFYIDPSEYGWGYFALSVVLVILIQDVLFYFSHRLLHTKRFMRYHAVHHYSKLPTPFAMYSFHYVEGIMHFVRLPIILLLIPICPLALLITEGLISNTVNAYSHLNHEPQLLRRLKRLHASSACTATVHDLHHSKGRGNYGFYFHFWDRVMGTHIPETVDRIKHVHDKWYSNRKLSS